MTPNLGATKRVVLAIPILLSILMFSARPAKADAFTFSTGNFYLDHIGNSGSVGTNYDILQLTGVSSTSFNLALGGSVTLPISTVDFTAGVSCYVGEPGCANNDQGYASFSVTVNGQTLTLSPFFTDTIGSSDTLNIGSAAISFDVGSGVLTLTSLSYGPIVNGGGDNTGSLQGTFSYTTPEPVSMILMGTFLSLAGLLLGRKRLLA